MSAIKKLNDKIEQLENEYIDAKFDYEQERAEMLLGTDFGAVIGKAKPTVAEKDAYISLQLGDKKVHYKRLGVEIDSLKRLFEILRNECGDNK